MTGRGEARVRFIAPIPRNATGHLPIVEITFFQRACIYMCIGRRKMEFTKLDNEVPPYFEPPPVNSFLEMRLV